MAKMTKQVIRQYLTDDKICEYDPYLDECDIEFSRTKVVATRKPQICAGNPFIGNGPHAIPPGTRCRFESALVDGKWGRYYTCIDCIVNGLLAFPDYFDDLEPAAYSAHGTETGHSEPNELEPVKTGEAETNDGPTKGNKGE